MPKRIPKYKIYFLGLKYRLIVKFHFWISKFKVLQIFRETLGLFFLFKLLYIFLLLGFQLYSGCFFEINSYLSDYCLNSSGTNYDPVRDICINENNITQEGGNSPRPVREPSEDLLENKTDTERLHDFLIQHEGKKLGETGIKLRGPVGEELKELSRIFAHVKKDKPHFFTLNELSAPSHTRLDRTLLNKIDSLKKNYNKGWPSGNR